MKKTKIIIPAFALFAISGQANAMLLDEVAACQPLVSEITKEDPNPFKYENPYSLEGCDLGFDFPGLSFDLNLSGFDFCSIAKNVTSKARDKWNTAVDDVNEWTNNTVDASIEDGVSVNGEEVVGGTSGTGIGEITDGAGSSLEGGNYSFDYNLQYDENGVPYYE